MSTPSYTCPWCRIPSAGADATCPHCGAPIDVRARVSKSGWAEQPPIRDMARIRFNRSTCQISGTYVPVAEMKLDQEDSVYFSHHVLLHGYGNVFQKTLQPGEKILVEPGGFLYKDSSVQMNTVKQSFKTGMLGSHNMFLAEMVGPGRVGIQSMYVHHGTE